MTTNCLHDQKKNVKGPASVLLWTISFAFALFVFFLLHFYCEKKTLSSTDKAPSPNRRGVATITKTKKNAESRTPERQLQSKRAVHYF